MESSEKGDAEHEKIYQRQSAERKGMFRSFFAFAELFGKYNQKSLTIKDKCPGDNIKVRQRGELF